MDKVKDLNTLLNDSWNGFLIAIPAILISMMVFVIGSFLIRHLSKITTNLIARRSKDHLVTDFLSNLISLLLMVILIMICLSILGWGQITDKILAGAGLTTFIIGFALKDIGENFLAGIMMAFKRPFRLGDTVEVNNIKGKVEKMTLRETLIKTLDGRHVFVPNGMILKNPLQNYTTDNLLRIDFSLAVGFQDNAEEALTIIQDIVKSYEEVEKKPAPQVSIIRLFN